MLIISSLQVRDLQAFMIRSEIEAILKKGQGKAYEFIIGLDLKPPYPA